MGCGKSTLADAADSESDLIITRETQTNENRTELVKIEGIEATENSLQYAGQDDDHPPPGKLAMPKNRRKLSQNGRDVENAWGAPKAKTNVVEKVPEKPQGRMLSKVDGMDFESEYGRDGVDITSTSVGKLENTSLVQRTSPDGMQLITYSEGANNPRVLHKQESEEAFDPSALIDIDKFKAANVPTKQTTKTNNDSEAAKEGNNNDPTKTVNPGEVEIVTAPSNYNEFYDDDEKQLIESIENDFVNTSPPILPGSAI